MRDDDLTLMQAELQRAIDKRSIRLLCDVVKNAVPRALSWQGGSQSNHQQEQVAGLRQVIDKALREIVLLDRKHARKE
jgi:hypothetical protein